MALGFSRLPVLAVIVLTLAMLASLGWQGYDIWESGGFQPSTNDSNPSADSDGKRSVRVPDISLADIGLFGKAGETAGAGIETTEDLPETNLRLFLRGVMAAEGDYPASALIEDSEGQTEAYVVGESLPGDASLHSVHPRRIIINRGGKLENLYFPELKASGGVQLADNSDSGGQTVTSAPRSRPPDAAAPAQRQAAEPSEARREQIRDRLQQLRERLRNGG
jgi:general secretion pathway protein C